MTVPAALDTPDQISVCTKMYNQYHHSTGTVRTAMQAQLVCTTTINRLPVPAALDTPDKISVGNKMYNQYCTVRTRCKLDWSSFL